ncbi:hypothetical protein [Flavobacterium sp.]|uniref:hypothetical protein n=1 Tax=Flavobacterium sp. TaxID=239 RepID=UPI00286DC930|nr:hypothetical protein [Flavobacterium sp.]
MNDLCTLYKSQRSKAKEVLELLEKQRDEINDKLKLNESSAILHKELRTVNLDIKITINEIDHAEYNIQECESKDSSILN